MLEVKEDIAVLVSEYQQEDDTRAQVMVAALTAGTLLAANYYLQWVPDALLIPVVITLSHLAVFKRTDPAGATVVSPPGGLGAVNTL